MSRFLLHAVPVCTSAPHREISFALRPFCREDLTQKLFATVIFDAERDTSDKVIEKLTSVLATVGGDEMREVRLLLLHPILELC
eukprot:COSAG01_NODE_10918_length_2051_cov_1.422643_2_plen_84_part_00